MKKIASICLLLLLVGTQTPLGQLFKLPLLLEHFVKHTQKDGVSFQGFLADHYANDQHQDEDLPEDEQLPFKNLSFFSISNAVVPVLVLATRSTILPADRKLIIPGIYLPQQHLASIFHPPRA